MFYWGYTLNKLIAPHLNQLNLKKIAYKDRFPILIVVYLRWNLLEM